MEIGVNPKEKNISIKLIGKEYEISFNRQVILWLDKEELLKLLNVIEDELGMKELAKPDTAEVLREVSDYKEEIEFDKDFMGLPDIKNLEEDEDEI